MTFIYTNLIFFIKIISCLLTNSLSKRQIEALETNKVDAL